MLCSRQFSWAAALTGTLCFVEAVAACGTGNWAGKVCNDRLNKTLTKLVFEVDGGSDTVVDDVTTDGVHIAGASVTPLETGKYEISIPMSLTHDQCYTFCIIGQHLSGMGVTTTKYEYVPADPPTGGFTVLVGDAPAFGDYTAWVDMFAIGGAPAGRVHFGVYIPPGMFGYFVQFNNLPTSTVPLTTFTLDQSQAAGPPLLVGDLGLPHDGTRACCDEPGYPVIPTAAFEFPAALPGTPLTSMVYDAGSSAIICSFAGGIPPGGTSNVLAYLSSSPPSIQASAELSPVVTALSPLGLLTTGRALGPRARTGDLDADLDRDLADFAAFAQCYTDAGAYAALGCSLADLDGDSDVDLIDYALLETTLTGPTGP